MIDSMINKLNQNITENEIKNLKGNVVFIRGEKLEDNTHRLYVTTMKDALKLDRKKVDNSEGEPATMAVFGNNQVYRVGYIDGNFKAIKVAWPDMSTMLKKLALSKPSVVLNDETGKTPIHWLSRNYNNVQTAVNALKPVLLALPNIRWEK